MNRTDEQVIKKALECCGIRNRNCIECPYYEKTYCVDADALNLINRKQDMIDSLIAGQESLQKALAEKNAEVERLTLENLQMVASIKRLKSEAIKEFWNRLKQEADFISSGDYGFSFEIREDVADNILKELTEQ